MSVPISFFNAILRASDESQFLAAETQPRPRNAKTEIAANTLLDVLLVKADALAYDLEPIRLVIKLISIHTSAFDDFTFARANIDLLRRICDFLFLTLLPRMIDACKVLNMKPRQVNSEVIPMLGIFEKITTDVVVKHDMDPTISCSRSIIKAIMEALFQIVNDVDCSAIHVRYGQFREFFNVFSTARAAFGADENNYRTRPADCWYFLVFEMMGQQLTRAVQRSREENEDKNANTYRIQRVAAAVVEIMARFVPTWELGMQDAKQQEEKRQWPTSTVAKAIAHNEQFWNGIENVLWYFVFNYESNDKSSPYFHCSSLLACLMGILCGVVPQCGDVDHCITRESFVLSITSASFVGFILDENCRNTNRNRYDPYHARNDDCPLRNDTLTQYLKLLCNIAKTKPQSFRNIFMKREFDVMSRVKKIFDAIVDGSKYDMARNLSAAFLWLGLIVDDFYKNDKNAKNITSGDILFPLLLKEVEVESEEDTQEKTPQKSYEEKLASAHPLAAFITHFCNTVLTTSLDPSKDFSSDTRLNIFHVSFGLDVLLRNLFPAGKRITWPDLTEVSLGTRLCNLLSDFFRERFVYTTPTPAPLEYVVEVSRLLNRLNVENCEAHKPVYVDDLPSFYFRDSLSFARFLISNWARLCGADRLEILTLIDSVVECSRSAGGRDASMWAKTEGESEQIFLCLMRLLELSVRDSIAEFELVSQMLRKFFENSFPFDAPAASTLWSLGRTLRRMDSPSWEKALLNVVVVMNTFYMFFVEDDDVFRKDSCSVLAEMLPVIVSTTIKVLTPSSSSPSSFYFDERALICDTVIEICWIVFSHLTAQNSDVATTIKDDEEHLSVFYEPEFASMLIITLETPIGQICEAKLQCLQLLVGLRQRCDNSNKSMDAIVKNDRLFSLLFENMKELIACDAQEVDTELRDAYQQVCTVVFKKNEDEMMKPQRREREEGDS